MSNKFLGVSKPFKLPLLEKRLCDRKILTLCDHSMHIGLYMACAIDEDGVENLEEFCEKNRFRKHLVKMSGHKQLFIQAVLFVLLFAIPAAIISKTSTQGDKILVSVIETVLITMFVLGPPEVKNLQNSLRGRGWLESNPTLFTHEYSMDVIKQICGCSTNDCTHPSFTFLVSHHPRNPTRFLSVKGPGTGPARVYFLVSWEKPQS